MRSIVAVSICAALLSSPISSIAATATPAAGSYGFDVKKDPQSAHCEAVSAAMIKQFKKCEITNGSFGGEPVDAYDCTGGHREFMVYASKAACIKSLETEKSNE